MMDDATALLSVRIDGANGATATIEGLVERNGLFWAEDLPLTAGANTVTLTATDAAGNASTTIITVNKSAVELTIEELQEDQLYQRTIAVNGTISVGDHTVWVNGARATVNGDGTWTANVPVIEGGTALVQARAIPNSDNGGNGSGGGGNGNLSNENLANPESPSAKDKEAQKDKQPQIRVRSYLEYNLLENLPHENYPWLYYTSYQRTWGYDQESTDGLIAAWNDPPGMVCSYDRTWPPDVYPPTLLGVMESDCWGHSDSELPPSMPWEYCDVRFYFGPYSNDVDGASYLQHVRRRAATRIELATGGKALSQRRNLFSITGNAEELKWQTWDAPGVGPTPIASERITMGSLGKLGSDGVLYKVLPDNQTYDITPRVAGKQFYRFGADETKHRFVISANGIPLESPPLPPLREFCVGEKVVFGSYFAPALQFNVGYSHWGIDGTFINKIIPAVGTQSPRYVLDESLLFTPGKFQPSATNWWLDGGVKWVVVVWKNITFPNGQSIQSFGAARKVQIYRPTLQGFAYSSPRSFTYVGSWFSYGDDEHVPEANIMHWWIELNSKYDGKKAITQLIEAQYTYWDLWGIPRDDVDTDEKFELDRDENYFEGNFDRNLPGSERFELKDSPAIDFGSLRTRVSIRGQFKDYIRFKPGINPFDGNIYVTLGIVEWSMFGQATSEGMVNNETPAPGDPADSIEFPSWEKILELPE